MRSASRTSVVVADEVTGEGEQVLEVEGTGPMLARAVLVIHCQGDSEEVLSERSRVGDTIGSEVKRSKRLSNSPRRSVECSP